MLNTKSFLCLDFGAGSLKAAEFEPTESGALRLTKFGIRSLGFEGSQDVARERILLKTLQELIAERGFTAKNVNICAPGFQVFSKFVKLPPVDASKVTQIIQYEAQQNVPFPLDEVAWDYQILGTSPSGELEVLLVAIKTDLVEALFRVTEACGLRIQMVDVSPAALTNSFRYNYGDLEGCTLLLDVGAKTSNLLFFEKNKSYSRGINIGANSITQDFSAESKLKFAEAEQIKIAEGFVSLGGAYEEPESPRQAAISKIARQVMTRLHIQVNQTMNFYRGQQGGGPPQRLFLAGGASIMPYTAQFFAEKLNVAVEYLNPFRNIEIHPSINLEELATVAHAFGEVVGLGLRNVVQCPVEMNLMPKSSLKRQQFNQKKPYFIATVFSLVAVVAAYGWFSAKLAEVQGAALANIKNKVDPLKATEEQLQGEQTRLGQLQQRSGQLTDWLQQRFFWIDLFTELRLVMQQVEDARKEALNGIENGIWIESFAAANPGLSGPVVAIAADEGPEPESTGGSMSEMMMKRYGLLPKAGAAAPAAAAATNKPVVLSSNELSVVNVTFRAVNLRRYSPTANDDLAYALDSQLRTNAMFDASGTKLDGKIENVDNEAPSFSFGMTLTLKRPLKLQ